MIAAIPVELVNSQQKQSASRSQAGALMVTVSDAIRSSNGANVVVEVNGHTRKNVLKRDQQREKGSFSVYASCTWAGWGARKA